MSSRAIALLTSIALVAGTAPPSAYGQTSAPPPPAAPPPVAAPATTTEASQFNTEQLDALLAPIALYPDVLLTQLLMATTYPLELVAAARWLAQGNNKDLKGSALEDALKKQPWDPSVKSLIPFPQVLDMLNQNLEWTQQLGYAMEAQQPEVFDSIQRLRLQAQNAGNLQSTPQQIVTTEPPAAPPPGVTVAPGGPTQVITIAPAQADTVYVPAYNPSVVYGTWPYPTTPPVYYPPPPVYGYGNALLTGLAFGTGVAITAGLWNLARPNWGCCWGGTGWRGGYNNVNVNVNRWNNVSVNRQWNGSANGAWRSSNPAYRPGGNFNRPGGPVGRPIASTGLPAGAIGRPSVSAPGGAVRPPSGLGPGNHPGIGAGGNRPGGGAGHIGQRPGGGGLQGAGQRPGGGAIAGGRPGAGHPGPVQRPAGAGNIGANRPAGGHGGFAQAGRPGGQFGGGRQPGAFNGMGDGRGASFQANRGMQSRHMSAPARHAGGGGFAGRGGGGGGHAGRGGGGRGGRR